MLRRLALLAMLFSVLTLSVQAEELFAVTSDGKLIRFDSTSPETTITSVAITGTQAGETIVGIDFRPIDGKLYALGSSSRLYTIAPASGIATQIGTVPFTTLLNGTRFGFNFNPTTGGGVGDRIRVTSDTAQNLRLNALTGVIAATDPAQAFVTNGLTGTPSVSACSYTNSVVGAGTTTLYVIDSNKDALFIQDTATHGLTLVGFLGVDTGTSMGLEISGQTGVAYASLTKAGQTGSTLFVINLLTGGASEIGDIGGGTVIGLTAPPPPLQIGYGLVGGPALRKFLLNAPATAVGGDIAVTGTAGNIVGLDFRPLNGLLYALSSNGNAMKLYSIDLTGATTTVAATQVGNDFELPNTPGGTNFDIDFNPTVDRIRVVTTTGTNARLHPDTGVIVAIDGNLAFAAGDASTGSPSVSAAAYINNFAGATTTTLYDLDDLNDVLTTQNPPNSGTLNTVGGIEVNGTPPVTNTNVGGGAGFDIAPDGRAFATLNGAVLYQINLATGTIIRIDPNNNNTGNITEFAIPINGGTTNTSGGAISFTAASFQAVEGTTVAITLTRTGGSAGLATVFITTSGNATVNSATPDLDYTPVGQSVSFADGETSRTVLFEALTDSTLEVFESVQLSITNPVGCAVGTQGTTTVIIVDVDDRDGDGFTTAEELAAGTSDNDASSTPFGGAPAGPANTTDLTITKASVKLNFTKTLSDSISFSGTISNFTDANFTALSGQKVVVNFGGVTKSVTLTAKGSSDKKLDKNNSVTIKKPRDNNTTITVKLNKGDFDQFLTDEGLADDPDSPSKAARTVVIRVLVIGKRYEETQALVVKISAGKGSSAVAPKLR